MRIFFLLLLFFDLPTSWSVPTCENLNSDLEKLASAYLDCMKTLSNTLMTTPNVTTKINPDISKAQKVQKGISDLVKGCENDDSGDSDAPDKIEDILYEVRELDADLQKMGIFENGAVNTARISAIEKSNGLIVQLLNFIGDDTENEEDDDDEENSYVDAKDDDDEEDDSDANDIEEDEDENSDDEDET